MLIADADHDNKIVDNVLALQRRCRAGLADLEARLAELDSVVPATAGATAARLEAAEMEIRSLEERLQEAQVDLRFQKVTMMVCPSDCETQIILENLES